MTAWRIVGVHHVQLAMPAGQEDVAEGFYAGVLGMQRVPKPEHLAALRVALRAADADVTEDTQLEGHERCYVRDPFGNRLELIEERSA